MLRTFFPDVCEVCEIVTAQRPSSAIINNTILMCAIPVVSIPIRNNKIFSLYKTLYYGDLQSYTFRLCKTAIIMLRISELHKTFLKCNFYKYFM